MFKFDNVFTIENLLEAHYNARKCKRHKNEVVAFEAHLHSNILALYNELKSGEYKITKYKKFMIYDPKEREIQALGYKDRLVQNNLCYKFLIPLYNKRFIYDNCACQKYKGTHFSRARLEKFLHAFYRQYGTNGYILKLDIKKYFNNINHDILKQKLGVIYDDKLKELVFDIIDSYAHHDNCGLPMGNQSSQIFALLYLDNIDRLIKEKFKIKYYVRYMDDLIVLHNDKYYLQYVFEELKKEFVKIKLILNKKSEIISLKNGIEYLGVRYSFLNSGKLLKKMKKQSKVRMINRINVIKYAFLNKKIGLLDVQMSLAGFKGNVKKLMINSEIKKYVSELRALII